MKNRLLILIIVLAVVLIGAGAWFWMNRATVSKVFSGNENTNIANVNTVEVNTNTVVTNASLPNEQKGDAVMDARGTVGSTELHFSSLSKAAQFEGDPAGANSMFVVVYFDGIDGTKVLPVKRALDAGEVTLKTNTGIATLATYKVASTAYQNDRGYLKFTVQQRATEFTLVVGAVGATQDIKLPL